MSITNEQLSIMIPVLAGLIGYFCYWFTQESASLKNKLEERYGKERASVLRILYSKYLGAITIGVLPILVYKIFFPETSLSELGLYFNPETRMTSILWIAVLAAVLIPVLLISSKYPKILAKQPEIRMREWPRSLLFYNLLAWAVYLLGYEFFFRGVLLFPLVDSIGLWPAIAINVVFYAGVHIPKGADEAIGAIPLAIVLCLLTVKTGTIWLAFFVHLAMSWTVTISALRQQPNMKMIKPNR